MTTGRLMCVRSFLHLAALAVILIGCCTISKPISASEDGAFDRALNDLEKLHRLAVDRSLEQIGPNERSRVMDDLTARGEDPRVLPLRFNAAGTPKGLVAPGFRILPNDLRLNSEVSGKKVAQAFLLQFAALWRVPPETFETADVIEGRPGSPRAKEDYTVEFVQRYDSLPVVGGKIVVHVERGSQAIVGMSGSFLPIEDLSTSPSIDETAAIKTLRLSPMERVRELRLVVWSDYLSGKIAKPRLAWRIMVTDTGGFAVRHVYVDAVDSSLLGETPVAVEDLRRSLWDLRSLPGHSSDTCQRWQMRPPYGLPYPMDLAGCPDQCAACSVEARDCALCTCRHPEPIFDDPPGCEEQIWRYDETAGCVANGDPLGEGQCDVEALRLWTDAGSVYSYWEKAFDRDSWDNTGNWLWLKVNPDRAAFRPAGRTQPKFVDNDDEYDLVQVTIQDGSTGPQLHGHELGHVLQFGSYTYVEGNSGFHGQGIDAMEHNADAHSFRYRDLPFGMGYRCGDDLDHYTRFRSASKGQSNKFIGNCHGWLMTHDNGGPITHHRVEVSPIPLAIYDQVWFRNLDVYFHTSHSYFDWWNDMVVAAHDLYGYSDPYYSARAAADAIGTWTDWKGVGSGVRREDRYPTVGWRGAPRGPCVFYRYTGSTEDIFWRCHTPRGWTDRALLNDATVDPAASEPSATFRFEPPGKNVIYVFWRGVDNRIRYRRFDVDTFAIGPPQDLGSAHLTSDVPVAAPIHASTTEDRLLVVYHPLDNPTYFYSTHLGSVDPPTDLGAALDSDVAPSLVAYPYGERIFLVRPDFELSPTPRHLRYASYTTDDGGTWSSPADNDITAFYNSDVYLPRNVVRSDRGVALAVHGLTPGDEKLRMLFVTLGDGADVERELWYATLSKTAARSGSLVPGDYRAVPLAPLTDYSSQSVGGIATGVTGYPLWHLWSPYGKLYQRRTYSD